MEGYTHDVECNAQADVACAVDDGELEAVLAMAGLCISPDADSAVAF